MTTLVSYNAITGRVVCTWIKLSHRHGEVNFHRSKAVSRFSVYRLARTPPHEREFRGSCEISKLPIWISGFLRRFYDNQNPSLCVYVCPYLRTPIFDECVLSVGFWPFPTTTFNHSRPFPLCLTFQHRLLYRCFSRPSEPPLSPSWSDEFIHIHDTGASFHLDF